MAPRQTYPPTTSISTFGPETCRDLQLQGHHPLHPRNIMTYVLRVSWHTILGEQWSKGYQGHWWRAYIGMPNHHCLHRKCQWKSLGGHCDQHRQPGHSIRRLSWQMWRQYWGHGRHYMVALLPCSIYYFFMLPITPQLDGFSCGVLTIDALQHAVLPSVSLILPSSAVAINQAQLSMFIHVARLESESVS